MVNLQDIGRKQNGQYSPRWLVLAVVVALLSVWFAGIDYRKLANPDEGRYAEIPREMAETGDWLTPRLNNIKYFEKPPLQYWITAAAYRAFGFHEWTARLWVALTGIGGIFLTWFMGRRLFGREAGAAAALVLLSSMYYVIFSNVLTLDMGFSFFLNLALAGYLLAQQTQGNERVSTAWAIMSWASAALAVLSKGFAGFVLPALALLTYTVMQRDWSGWRNLRLVPGGLLALLIAAPWFIGVSVANPEFFEFFFVHEHLQRFASTAHHRAGPLWYFVPLVLVAVLPWMAVTAEGLVEAWRYRAQPDTFNAPRFLLAWIVSQFVFFSISGSKLPAYILPIVPALALITGWRLSQLNGRQIAKRVAPLAVVAGIACLAGTEAMEAMQAKQIGSNYYEDYSDWLETASVLIAVAGVYLWWKRDAKRMAVAGFGIACFIAAELVVAGFEQLSPLQSAANLAQTIKPYLKEDTPVFMVQTYNQSLPPYIQRPVTLVDYEDELYFGLQQEPERWIPTLDEFVPVWRSQQQAVAVMPAKTFQKLEEMALPMRLIRSDGDLRVVVRQK